MQPSILIKSVFAFILKESGIVSLKIKNKNEKILILMYHRVIPKFKTRNVQAGMYVEPETFGRQLQFLRRHFDVVSLDRLRIRNKTEMDSGKTFCVLTFDDGWSDFYQYAYPLLKENGLPATVFLATDFIGSSSVFWTDRLAHIMAGIKKAGSEKYAATKDEISTIVGKCKDVFEVRLENAIEFLKHKTSLEIEQILTEISYRYNIREAVNERVFLNWQEVREMYDAGLITFGSHTAGHPILTTSSTDEIQNELLRSKNRLISENIVDPEAIPFCYPNGNHTKYIADMVKEAGYCLAVTTRKGWNGRDAHPFMLKRIGIHQDMSFTDAMFGCRIAGIF